MMQMKFRYERTSQFMEMEERLKKYLHSSIAMANAFPNCIVHAVDCDQVFAIIINIVNINLGIILMIIKMIRLLGFNREGKAEHKSS